MKKEKYTYLMTDGRLFKIGQSVNPEGRLKTLKTGNPHIELITYGNGVTEKYLHEFLFRDRIVLEWFDLAEDKIENIKNLINKGESGRKKGNVKIETIEINGIKFKNKRTGKYFALSDSEKKRISDGVRKSEDLSKKYIINFGKYNGTKITEMTSDEQYDYCVWIYNRMKEELSTNKKKKSRKYKAFSWAVKNNK